MKTKQTIELLQKLIDYYEKYVNEDNINKITDLTLLGGVCFVIDYVFNISDKNNSYWINRHIIKGNSYWFMTPLMAYRQKLPIRPTLEYRINILKKELAHHKKWGFLARFIKP